MAATALTERPAGDVRVTGTVWTLVRAQLALLLRTPVVPAAVFALPFAVLLVLMLVVGFRFPTIEFGAMPGVRVIDRLVPEMAGTVAAAAGILVITLHLSETRATGMLRRLRRTRMRDASYLTAQAIVAGALVAASTLLFMVVTFVIYGLPRSWHPLYLAGALLVVTYCSVSAGLLLGGLRMSRIGARVAAPLCFALLFLGSGLGVPREGWEGVAPWFYQVTTVNPLAQLNDFVFHAYQGRLAETWPAVAGLLATAVVANVMTRRVFDWEGTS
ncbi:ABC transporter permease [Nonomuraea sp. NPDC050786]|uniref:ABC transporter permease n=1 Tax=Nonomuraea sp. NPDC050786 TaxID=3154840 RepID=UPI0033F9CB8C